MTYDITSLSPWHRKERLHELSKKYTDGNTDEIIGGKRKECAAVIKGNLFSVHISQFIRNSLNN